MKTAVAHFETVFSMVISPPSPPHTPDINPFVYEPIQNCVSTGLIRLISSSICDTI